jgi:DNA-binding transcriptional ArsR family regulator
MLNQGQRLDRVFQALADATRRDMVERLIRGPATVTELAQPFAMSLPAVMQHLQVLEACGLVRSEKVGRVRTCHIEPGVLRMAEDWIVRQRTSWEQRLDRLGDYLTEHSDEPEQGSTP